MTTLAINSVSKLGRYQIIAFTPEGDFILKHSFGLDDPRLVLTLQKIEAAGQIDTRHWRKKVYQRKPR